MWAATTRSPWADNAAIAALPASHLERFEHSGHYPFIEEPDRFAAVVAACFSSVAERQVP
jgi:pimeloyl-ACP methyl ester carboxylesterase